METDVNELTDIRGFTESDGDLVRRSWVDVRGEDVETFRKVPFKTVEAWVIGGGKWKVEGS